MLDRNFLSDVDFNSSRFIQKNHKFNLKYPFCTLLSAKHISLRSVTIYIVQQKKGQLNIKNIQIKPIVPALALLLSEFNSTSIFPNKLANNLQYLILSFLLLSEINYLFKYRKKMIQQFLTNTSSQTQNLTQNFFTIFLVLKILEAYMVDCERRISLFYEKLFGTIFAVFVITRSIKAQQSSAIDFFHIFLYRSNKMIFLCLPLYKNTSLSIMYLILLQNLALIILQINNADKLTYFFWTFKINPTKFSCNTISEKGPTNPIRNKLLRKQNIVFLPQFCSLCSNQIATILLNCQHCCFCKQCTIKQYNKFKLRSPFPYVACPICKRNSSSCKQLQFQQFNFPHLRGISNSDSLIDKNFDLGSPEAIRNLNGA